MASLTSAAPPRSGSTTAADAKKRKREDVLPASFAWHQYIVVPPSVRKLSMYRLKGFKGFTPEAFYHFQDHLLALKIGHLVDGTEVPTSLEVCNVPTKFYGYFCGRLKTHQYLHLLIFSYLNEIVPFEIIKSMPFFKQTQNDRIRCLTGKKRRATIKITKTYTTPVYQLTPTIKKAFEASVAYWVHGKDIGALAGPLLCQVKFDNLVNSARDLFVVSLIRAKVPKQTIARFCASQFLGGPMKSWTEVFNFDADRQNAGAAQPGQGDSMTLDLHGGEANGSGDGSGSSDSHGLPMRNPQPDAAAAPAPSFIWSMDPREYMVKTWRFLSGAPSVEPDPATLKKFMGDVEREFPGCNYNVRDVWSHSGKDSVVFESPGFQEIFGPREGRWQYLANTFTTQNMYRIFSYLFSPTKYMIVSGRLRKLNGEIIDLKGTFYQSNDRRYFAVVLTGSNSKETNAPLLLTVEDDFLPVMEDRRSHVWETIRFVQGFPTKSGPDRDSWEAFVGEIRGGGLAPRTDCHFEIFDFHQPYEGSLVYFSPGINALYAPWSERIHRVRGNVFSVKKFFHILQCVLAQSAGISVKVEIETTTNEVDYVQLRMVRSKCGRYLAHIINPISKKTKETGGGSPTLATGGGSGIDSLDLLWDYDESRAN